MRYRKKPQEVDAWQVGTEPVPDFVKTYEKMRLIERFDDFRYEVTTPSDILIAKFDYFIVLDDSDLYVYEPDIFEQTYEVVE